MTGRCANRAAAPFLLITVILSAKKVAVILSESAVRRTSRKPALSQPKGACILLFGALLVLVACHSYHIDITIENRTGAPVQLIEVDYPSASFGVDSLANGATFNYRFQVRGNGRLKLSFTAADGKQVQITGPALAEHQQGRLEIVLLPGSRADFLPHLTPQP